jgi:rare lipoprotein A
MNTNSRKATYAVVPLAACLLVSGCSSVPKGSLPLDLGITDRGIASWYGKEFDGRLAANGEVFDMKAYTAAHRKLPLGSIVRVINLQNGRAVQVRITDRGPYILGRMLDLSYAAAQELGMVASGTVPVHIQVVGNHRVVPPIPAGTLSALTGMGLSIQHRDGSDKGYDLLTAPLLTMPQQALYVRRERRVGSTLALDHTAHNTVSTLIAS